MYIAPGHGHTTTWYKFRHHFKAFIISISLYQFQKDPFCLNIWYFVLFHTCTYSPRVRGRQPLETFLFMEAERSYHFDHWLHDSKRIFALWFYARFFIILYMYIALAGADNPLGPTFWCQQEGLIALVIYCKFQKISSTSDFTHIFSWFNNCI